MQNRNIKSLIHNKTNFPYLHSDFNHHKQDMELTTYYVCSALSLHVYRDKDQPPLPPEWSLFFDCPPDIASDGFFAAAYVYRYRVEDQPPYNFNSIVIAYRGTNSFKDVLQDYLIWIGNAPKTFLANVLRFHERLSAYMDNLARQTGESYGVRLSTGHSLGGILAELSAGYYLNYWNQPSMRRFGNCYTVMTFESPGSTAAIQDLINQGIFRQGTIEQLRETIGLGFIESFYSDINAINTCQLPINYAATPNLKIAPYEYSGVPNEPSRLYYTIEFSFNNQHRMINFYNYFRSHLTKVSTDENQLQTANGWPVGFEAGYRYYTTYDYHPQYWDGYIRAYYDGNPIIQKLYTYEKFHSLFISSFLLRKDEIKHLDRLSIPQNELSSVDYSMQMRKLILAKNNNDKLPSAVLCGNLKLLERLLKEGADINFKEGIRQYSLVHLAILADSKSTLDFLLAFGADPNQPDIFGNSPLHLIASRNFETSLECTKLLVQAGANIEAINNKGKTPVEIAEEINPEKAQVFAASLASGFVYISKEEIHAEPSPEQRRCLVM